MNHLTITFFSILGSIILLMTSKRPALYLAATCLMTAQILTSVLYWHGYNTLIGGIIIILLSIYALHNITKHSHHIDIQLILLALGMVVSFWLLSDQWITTTRLILVSAVVTLFSGLLLFSKAIKHITIVGSVLMANGIHLISIFGIWTSDLPSS